MIIENYSAFRHAANPGGTIGIDGLPEFNQTKMRANGFNYGFALTSTTEFPFGVNVLGPNIIIVEPADYFDWYVSQRTSVADDKPFDVTRGLSFTGDRIIFDLSLRVSDGYPDPFDLSAIRVLFFGVDIYVIRRSDGAIQRLDLMQFLIDVNSPKTDLE